MDTTTRTTRSAAMSTPTYTVFSVTIEYETHRGGQYVKTLGVLATNEREARDFIGAEAVAGRYGDVVLQGIRMTVSPFLGTLEPRVLVELRGAEFVPA